MQITTRGWSFVGTIVGLYAAGRALGTVELSMLAAAGLLALVSAAVVVRIGKPTVSARRVLRPRRLHAGATAHAEIEVRNPGRRRTGVLSVTDRFSGRREARFAVAPLRPGESARGAYLVPTSRRGIFEIGPLRVGVTDPFGLVRRILQHDASESITVFPRIDFVAALPLTAGRDLVGGAVNDFTRTPAGMEFHSLREYQLGDDLRRVHWRSTARTGQLMIRENDVPWQTRATLLLDDRVGLHPPAAFERTIEAVASVATALNQRRAIIRLVTVGGVDTGFGSRHEHYESIMERLAIVDATTDKAFEDAAARLHRQTASGALIAFLGTGPRRERAHADADLRNLSTLGRRFGFVAAVRIQHQMNRQSLPAAVPGVTSIDVAPDAPFSLAWNEAMVLRFGVRGAG